MNIFEYSEAISFLMGWVGQPIFVFFSAYRGIKGDLSGATFFMVVGVYFQGMGK